MARMDEVWIGTLGILVQWEAVKKGGREGNQVERRYWGECGHGEKSDQIGPFLTQISTKLVKITPS